jgi:hypothetical protein
MEPIPENDISSDSAKIISNMSKEEILESKREINKTISPKLIEILTKRALEKQDTMKEAISIPIPMVETIPTPIVETVKWMQPIIESSGESTSIRYDFEGKVITKDDNLNSGLYHHGDEPDKPGYTIDELLYLLHSTVSSQRVIALGVFERILVHHQNHSYGDYLTIFDKLMQNDLGILLFLCIDDKNVNIVNAALKTLLAMISCETNENWFDFLDLNTFQGYQSHSPRSVTNH